MPNLVRPVAHEERLAGDVTASGAVAPAVGMGSDWPRRGWAYRAVLGRITTPNCENRDRSENCAESGPPSHRSDPTPASHSSRATAPGPERCSYPQSAVGLRSLACRAESIHEA